MNFNEFRGLIGAPVKSGGWAAYRAFLQLPGCVAAVPTQSLLCQVSTAAGLWLRSLLSPCSVRFLQLPGCGCGPYSVPALSGFYSCRAVAAVPTQSLLCQVSTAAGLWLRSLLSPCSGRFLQLPGCGCGPYSVPSLSGFWLKTSEFREQPDVHFKHEMIAILNTAPASDYIVYSTFHNFNQLQMKHFRPAFLKVASIFNFFILFYLFG